MSSEHDLDRIMKGVEAFYAMFDRDNVEDFTLDQFMIIGIVSARMNDSEQEVEAPVLWCSSQRVYVQRGMLEVMLDQMKMRGAEERETEEDE